MIFFNFNFNSLVFTQGKQIILEIISNLFIVLYLIETINTIN